MVSLALISPLAGIGFNSGYTHLINMQRKTYDKNSYLFDRYGEHAGLLTENTLFAAGNVAMTAHNADNLGIKAIAKRTAKATGKAVLHDIKEVHKSQQLDENSQDRKGINDKDKMPL